MHRVAPLLHWRCHCCSWDGASAAACGPNRVRVRVRVGVGVGVRRMRASQVRTFFLLFPKLVVALGLFGTSVEDDSRSGQGQGQGQS